MWCDPLPFSREGRKRIILRPARMRRRFPQEDGNGLGLCVDRWFSVVSAATCAGTARSPRNCACFLRIGACCRRKLAGLGQKPPEHQWNFGTSGHGFLSKSRDFRGRFHQRACCHPPTVLIPTPRGHDGSNGMDGAQGPPLFPSFAARFLRAGSAGCSYGKGSSMRKSGTRTKTGLPASVCPKKVPVAVLASLMTW